MARWSFVLALSLIALGSVAGEPSASAAPPRPTARVHRRHGRHAEPPAQPAISGGAFESYNLDRVNAYRRAGGLAPVVLDAGLTAFAREGSLELMNDHVPHQHFRSAGSALWNQGFKGNASENQGSNTGWPRAASDPTQNEQRQIDQILASMMGEGPGGGHYANMMSPKAKRVGIGLVEDSAGKLYLTNDFSE